MSTTTAADETTMGLPSSRRGARARARFNRVMRVVRLAHLYSGLFMTPWVFLYGVSAYLFNHPDHFSDQRLHGIDAAHVAGTPLEHPPDPAGLAGRVVAAINAGQDAGTRAEAASAKPAGGGTPARPTAATPVRYRLVAPEAAAFNRELMTFARGDGDRDYLVRLNLEDGTGVVREVERRERVVAPFAGKLTGRLDPPFAPLVDGVPKVLKGLGLPARSATLRLAPDLKFRMEGGGRTWDVTYNAQTGQVFGRPASDPSPPPTFRRYLILLHVAHGFPPEVGARWVWAIAVDLMFVSMVGWGVTGLLMWWQMKNVRRVGVAVLLASLVCAAVLAVAMHGVFVAEGLS